MSNAFTRPFKQSIYAKEELPVWSEIWEQFIMNSAFIYDPTNPEHNRPAPTSSKPEVILNSLDIYWQQPHRKLLLGWMANELNKLVTEDGRLDEIKHDLIIFVDDATNDIVNPQPPVTNLVFSVMRTDDPTPAQSIETVIYTQLSPTTGSRSIFASADHTFVDMATLDGTLELVMEVSVGDPMEFHRIIRPSDMASFALYDHILRKFLEPIKFYFDEPVGWKDEGYVPSPLTRRCQNLGVDAGL